MATLSRTYSYAICFLWIPSDGNGPCRDVMTATIFPTALDALNRSHHAAIDSRGEITVVGRERARSSAVTGRNGSNFNRG
jgi:hypothetical protein